VCGGGASGSNAADRADSAAAAAAQDSASLLSAAEARTLSGRLATCSGRAPPPAAEGEPLVVAAPADATPLRRSQRCRHSPKPYWLVTPTTSALPESRPTPAGAGAAQ
jgi:hypothetical protein